MSANTASVDHIFNTIRREISEEFPDLSLVFLVYDKGQAEHSFKSKRREIEEHPAGKALAQKIEESLKPASRGDLLIGLQEHQELKFFGLSKKSSYIGACFIDSASLEHFKNVHFSCSLVAYTSAFKGISDYLKQTRKQTTAPQEKPKTDPASIKNGALRLKLMSDCFASMMMESTGHKGAIHKTIKNFCTLCMEPSGHFAAENHPLPIAIDGVSIVHKDLKDQAPPNMGLLEHTHFMAKEIGETYDDLALSQWVRFCWNITDMIWAGFERNKVLSTAVYTSDNPYVRSYAHIFSETLNTSPVPLKNSDFYNPFAEIDANERTHVRASRITFLSLLEQVNQDGNAHIFLMEARKQTKELLEGRPIGWCAPALIEAENAYRLFKENPVAEEEMINNAFEASFSRIKWRALQQLNRKFIAYRRTGKKLTPEKALAIIAKDESYKPYANAFELLKSAY